MQLYLVSCYIKFCPVQDTEKERSVVLLYAYLSNTTLKVHSQNLRVLRDVSLIMNGFQVMDLVMVHGHYEMSVCRVVLGKCLPFSRVQKLWIENIIAIFYLKLFS